MQLVIYIVGSVVICILISMLVSVYWIDYQCKRMKSQPFRIVYNNECKGATFWRNTHPAYWKRVKMARGSTIIMPVDMWLEINPNVATPNTFLHELGHIQMDIAWLTLEGHVYYHMIKASKDDLHLQAVLEFIAWGIAAQIGEINKEWLLELMLRIYGRLFGETKVRTSLMIALSTPLNKPSIVLSTRRILKVLYM